MKPEFPEYSCLANLASLASSNIILPHTPSPLKFNVGGLSWIDLGPHFIIQIHVKDSILQLKLSTNYQSQIKLNGISVNFGSCVSTNFTRSLSHGSVKTIS